jgi:hypothetical protein
VRRRTPVIVIAVVPGRSWPCACANASPHSDGTVALVILNCCATCIVASCVHCSLVGS